MYWCFGCYDVECDECWDCPYSNDCAQYAYEHDED